MTISDEKRAYKNAFAEYYDRLMSRKKYAVWKQLIFDVAQAYEIQPCRCLDLACGTGEISKMLSELGFQPEGVDLSQDMLAIAREKVPQAHFTRADMRDFTLETDGPIKFAVCFYDSLNYLLSDEDMLAAFKSVKRCLMPGSIFLFDMNTREHVAVSQKNKPCVFEWDDVFVIFRYGGEERTWTINPDMFVKQADNSYQREHELHTERGYDEADIVPLLKQAGFEHLETRREMKTYEDGREHPNRLYFIARV